MAPWITRIKRTVYYEVTIVAHSYPEATRLLREQLMEVGQPSDMTTLHEVDAEPFEVDEDFLPDEPRSG
jgi:hypothetical protein